jgi:hypothetical protein
MTCRYAHKRVATLFTLVQAMPAARVIDWPQKSIHAAELRLRSVLNGKPREATYANK